MGSGTGNSTKGGGTGGVDVGAFDTTSLVSERERQREEVDQTLTVLRDFNRDYGDISILEDVHVATPLERKGRGVMGYYDSEGNLAITSGFFDTEKMNSTYDDCSNSGFHPSRGNRTGIEAVTAHEMGHKLTDEIGKKLGLGNWAINEAAQRVVREAARNAGYGRNTRKMIAAISRYGAKSNAEGIAEACADVYCNGDRAKRESRAIMDVVNRILRRRA